MVRATEKEALEKSLEMWAWIRDEVSKGRVHTKRDWFAIFQEPIILNDCFLCEFAQEKFELGNKCKNCPVESWRKTPCTLSFRSPYNIWRSAVSNLPHSNPSTITAIVEGATGIVDLLKQNLERVEKGGMLCLKLKN